LSGQISSYTYVLVLGLGVDELLAEVLPVVVARGFVDDDLLVVVRELVDDVLVLLAELQVVVGGDALLRDRGSVIGYVSVVSRRYIVRM